jgi:electron transfer flavoprotein beta subunit
VNIVVCVKSVPSQVKNPTIVKDGLEVSVETLSMIINESDEHALEQALALKKNIGATVTVITVGSVKSQDVLQRSLAKGADGAIRVDGDEFDPNITALKLSRAIQRLNYDLILTGVESLDGMSSQVAISVAAHLQAPFAYAVTRIDPAGSGTVRIDRELGGGRYQTLEMAMPALLSVQSGSGTLTYPAAAKLVQARRRPIPSWSLADLGMSQDDLAAQRRTRIVDIRPRDSRHEIDWLTGTAEEIADRILSRIDEAL